MTQSLLTGNLEPIARLKLTCAGLAEYVDFELGAFGSDHHDRTCLVPITRQRLRERLRRRRKPTSSSSATRRAISPAPAPAAHVQSPWRPATSHARSSRSTQPDVLLDDLQDTEAVLATLLNASAALQ